MTITVSELEAQGWFLSEEGIELITSENPEIKTVNDFITAAKDTDLRQLSSKGFNKTNEKVSVIPSPCVLQVLEVRNIAMPSVNQVEKPRLLSIVFTDGSKKKYKGVEALGKVDCIKLHTSPGTKFLVTKPIEIKDQILLLGPNMLKDLGGHVQELVQAWRAGKQFLKRFGGKTNSTKEGEHDQGPPAFIPFKVKPNFEKKPKSTADDPSKPKKKETKQVERSNESKTKTASEKKKSVKENNEKKKEEIVPSESNSVSLEKPKHKKKSERKPKKDGESSVDRTIKVPEEKVDEQSKAIPQTIATVEENGNVKKEKRSERKKENIKKSEKKKNVDKVEQVQNDVVSEDTDRKKRDKKPVKKAQDPKNPVEKVERSKKPVIEKSETKKSNGKTGGRESLDADKAKSKQPSDKTKSVLENSADDQVDSKKPLEEKPEDLKTDSKKPSEKSERKGKKRSDRKGSTDKVNEGTVLNEKSKKTEAKKQPSQENRSEASTLTITEKNLNEAVENTGRKVRKERKKKSQTTDEKPLVTENGVEEQHQQQGDELSDPKSTSKKKKERTQKNRTENKTDSSRGSKKKSSHNKQELEIDMPKKEEQHQTSKPTSENIVPETSSTSTPTPIPTVVTPVMHQTTPQSQTHVSPSQQQLPQQHQQQQQQQQQQQAIYYNNVGYDDYYYQQPYTTQAVDYGMVVPMMNPNTNMTMYGYQQQAQYVQPVYYMPDHHQQPYYNQYMQPHQPQTQYYDHQPQQHYQSNGYRGRGGRGGGNGGRGGNSYRGGYDQQ